MSGYKLTTQNPRELEAFLDWLVENRINVYYEIGLYAGTTFKAVYDTLLALWEGDTSKFLMLGCDLPSNPEAFKACQESLKEMPTAKVWWTSSTDKDTVEEVISLVTDKWVAEGEIKSVVFIDGNHSYAQARDDFMAYEAAFTYVAFNDISPGTVMQNQTKHANLVAATAYHLYDALKISNGVDEIAYWDMPDGGNQSGNGLAKYRGIGVLT